VVEGFEVGCWHRRGGCVTCGSRSVIVLFVDGVCMRLRYEIVLCTLSSGL